MAMSDADTEAVLRDLLMECGVEGVTLWHMRSLAAYQAQMEQRTVLRAGFRFQFDPESTQRLGRYVSLSDLLADALGQRLLADVRGEDAVLAEAWAENDAHGSRTAQEIEARLTELVDETFGVCSKDT